MSLIRVLEVWEKAEDGAMLRRIRLDPRLDSAVLASMFESEQKQPDPSMLMSYWVNPQQLVALQAFSPEPLSADRYDYILSASWIHLAEAQA